FPLQDRPSDSLLFFGRIHPDKGVAEAIDVAARAGLPLTIAGIVHDQAYFHERIAPRVDDDQVRYVGSVGPDERAALLGDAVALLHLINFDEPFGFSVIEAMACGTPVIAVRRGSLPELVIPGVNGFLVDSVDEATDAVEPARSLDRAGVRASVVEHFDASRMVDEYVTLYEQLIGPGGSAG
ncbi:MAG: hypothetical protein QOI81_1292, partial [Actinomycetota bacterium]|nr:hypothetical protein [Actinomycetota bacterium]